MSGELLWVDQVSSLQDINKRLQEYNTSLQQYNSKMQAEASNAAEAISRTQKEKAAIMENLSTLRGTTTSLNTQLNAAKASFISLSHKSDTSASNRKE